MMNSKVFLYFSVILVIWSSYAASYPTEDQDIGKRYQNSNGEVIYEDDERHPDKKCADKMGDRAAFWANIDGRCSENVICQGSGKGGSVLQLDEKPLTGVVCSSFRDFEDHYSVCIQGKCVDL